MKPGYKQTEVGVIPDEWKVRTIGEMFRLVNGCAFKPTDWKPSGTPIIRIQNLNDPTAEFNFSQAPVPEKNRVEAGDLLFAWSGTLGSSFGARVWNGPSGVLNQHIFKVHMDESRITLPFSLLVFSRVEDDIGKQAHGFKASFVHVKKSDLVKVPLPLPSLPEQRAIAAALSEVDALLAALDRLIAKKRDLKQAAMQQLLTGQTRLPGFEGEWIEESLKAIVETPVTDGPHLTPRFFDTGIPFLSVNNLVGNRIDLTDLRFISQADHELFSKKCKPRRNDILLGKAASVGKVALVDLDCEFNIWSPIALVRVNSAHSARFVYYQLQSRDLIRQIALLTNSSSQGNIGMGDIEKLTVKLPPLPEQTAIAAVLSDMDAELAALDQRREKTRALKQGMMQELLTGRTRLVVPASVEPPAANVVTVDFPQIAKTKPAASEKSHNWAINEAVVVAVLAQTFGSEKFPLGRKRCTKLSYLLHRHVERVAQGYLKKAAGPYNPSVKYSGPEGIAQKNGYIRPHKNGSFSGFVAADKIAQAEGYFEKWYGREVLAWLEQFRFKSNDELELLATVDMAAEDLRREGKDVNLPNLKSVISSHREWEAKLDREIFSDSNIERAAKETAALFH